MSRTAVTLTHITRGHIGQEMSFPAFSVYQRKSVQAAPVSGFVTKTPVERGTVVRTGDTLYEIECKEHRALGDAESGASAVIVKSSCAGFVLETLYQTGDYVTEGTVLCTVAEYASLVFEIDVPCELRGVIRNGSRCLLEMPDGTLQKAVVTRSAGVVNKMSQTERVIARADSPKVPEGLCVKAVFRQGSSGSDGMRVPLAALQSNETLTEHWVMKVVGGCRAERVPVTVVGKSDTEVEIQSSSLSLSDSIVLGGAYGLEDGSEVEIVEGGGAL